MKFDLLYTGFSGATLIQFTEYFPDITLKTTGQIIILTLTCLKLYYSEIKQFIQKRKDKKNGA